MSKKLLYSLLAVGLFLALLLHVFPMSEALGVFRPFWAALILCYWSWRNPERSVFIPAWFTGICLDVLFNSALGCHALALVLSIYVFQRIRNTLRTMKISHGAVLMTLVWLTYAFILFWADGATGHSASSAFRWWPIISTSLMWPLLHFFGRLFTPEPHD